MRVTMVQAPVSLLHDPDLTAPAKVLWLAMRLHAEPVMLTRLAASSALATNTVRKSLPLLEAACWHSPSTGPIERSPSGARVSIPANLLHEPRVRPQAKLLYGALQIGPAYRNRSGEFTYKTLSEQARLSVVTVRQLVRELTESGWIQARQTSQKAPIRFTLRNPELDRSAAEAALAERRLVKAEYRGEALMREYLSLLIESDEFEDNARPGFLVNPLTNERMELDRYYPPVVGFEFNGPQHDNTTERFPSEYALAMQKARDLMKEAICTRRGVRVVVIHRKDLTLKTMLQKIGNLLPLRDLRGHEELIQVLEKARKRHRT